MSHTRGTKLRPWQKLALPAEQQLAVDAEQRAKWTFGNNVMAIKKRKRATGDAGQYDCKPSNILPNLFAGTESRRCWLKGNQTYIIPYLFAWSRPPTLLTCLKQA